MKWCRWLVDEMKASSILSDKNADSGSIWKDCDLNSRLKIPHSELKENYMKHLVLCEVTLSDVSLYILSMIFFLKVCLIQSICAHSVEGDGLWKLRKIREEPLVATVARAAWSIHQRNYVIPIGLRLRWQGVEMRFTLWAILQKRTRTGMSLFFFVLPFVLTPSFCNEKMRLWAHSSCST
jgi:hypothetical protein